MGFVCCYASDKVLLIIPNKLNFLVFSIIIDDSSDLNFIHGFKFQYALSVTILGSNRLSTLVSTWG